MIFRMLAGTGLGGWIQVFYRRVHGLPSPEISLALAIITPVGGFFGSLIGGVLADLWTKRWNTASRACILVLSHVGAMGLLLVGLLVQDSVGSLAAYGFSFILSEMWSGPGIAIAQDVAPSTMRALAITIFYISGNIGSCGPLLAGMINELIGIKAPYADQNDAYDPTYSLYILVIGGYIVSAIGFSITAVQLNNLAKTNSKETKEVD